MSGVPGEDGLVLDELGRERLTEGRQLLAALLGEHDRMQQNIRKGPLPGDIDREALEVYDEWEPADHFSSFSIEQLRCLLFAVAERLTNESGYFSDAEYVLHQLSERDLDLAAGDVRLLAAVSEPGDGTQNYVSFRLVVDLVEKLLRDGAVGASALAEDVADQVLAWTVMVHHDPDSARYYRSPVADVRDKAVELAGRPPVPLAEGVVGRDDGYGLAVIERLGLVEDWPAEVAALLAHCAKARSARPSAGWQKVCRRRLDAVPDVSALLRGLLDLVVTAEPVTFMCHSSRRAVLIGYNERLVRGLVWAAGVLDPDWLPEVLRAVAVRCLRLCRGHVYAHTPTPVPGEKIPYACFRALGMSGSDASLRALVRIGRATSNRRVLQELEKTLAEASTPQGMSAASLLDRLTPDHDLDAAGQLGLGSGWVIRLDDREGAVLTGPPGQQPPGQAADLLAEVKATVAIVRQRLEDHFTERREWHCDDFTEHQLQNPVNSWFATRLAWTFTPPGGPAISGFPDPDGHVIHTPVGPCPVPPGCLVRLLHPLLAAPGELGQLRQLAVRRGIIQPVRQLWRETYRLTGTERQDGLASDRYAGHILRFQQAYGLGRRRGWAGGFLSGAWDGGDSATARKAYPVAGLRASWAIAEQGGLSGDVAVDLCLTGLVSFFPLEDKAGVPVPLADLPPEVFSEAMRDLDLIVSVTTVANDPLWLEQHRGHSGLERYWEAVTRDGLDQLRAHRHEMLTALGATPGDRFELTSADLIVKGSLATYRIDLATANVRLDRTGRWLSFDTRLTTGNTGQYQIPGLPALDDDEILHRILIRAAILADDDQLASRDLLKQIRG